MKLKSLLTTASLQIGFIDYKGTCKVKENVIYITGRKGVQIPAAFEEGIDTNPVVIMAHGLQGSKDEYLNTQLRIADELKKLGIGSLRIDFRGHGESEQSLEEFSLKSQIEDLVTAIEWLKNKEDNLRIITLGISFGAPPIMVVSELYSSIIKKCVLIAPVVDYKNTFLYPVTDWGRENFGYKKIIEGICTGGINLDEKYRLGREVLMDILLVDVAQFVKNTSYPMYIFHGESDNMVPAIL